MMVMSWYYSGSYFPYCLYIYMYTSLFKFKTILGSHIMVIVSHFMVCHGALWYIVIFTWTCTMGCFICTNTYV